MIAHADAWTMGCAEARLIVTPSASADTFRRALKFLSCHHRFP
jgi:hypothetical protein